MPQLAENYRSKSAEGISLAFLLVWFVGDITNLLGAVWANLVPTVIALALYFCLADAVLILQCLYYKRLNSRKNWFGAEVVPDNGPHQPLLAGDHSGVGPGSRSRRASSFKDGSLPVLSDEIDPSGSWAWNTASVVSICALGAAVWAIAWKTRLWTPTPQSKDDNVVQGPLGAMILGYLSAVCYLG